MSRSNVEVDFEYLCSIEKDAEAYTKLYQAAFDAAQALGCFVDNERWEGTWQKERLIALKAELKKYEDGIGGDMHRVHYS